MAENDDEQSVRGGDGAAHWVLSGASSEAAEAYLKAQTRLALLQAEDLEREDAVRHWSLRVRHVSDVLKLSLELAAAAIVLAIAIFIGAAVWNATHDNGLVIEAFNVPADMAASGLTGQVVATQMQDRLSWMQSRTDTIRAASTYRNNWGDDIKVQIPDTGVSVGDFYRYLVGWLGHEKHITGEVWHTSTGVALTVRSGSDAAHTFTAAVSGLDGLIAKAAEQVYRETQPYRYTVYLGRDDRRTAEYLDIVRAQALHGAPEDRPWAYSRWGLYLLTIGDYAGGLEKQRIAIALNPNLPHVWGNLGGTEVYYGHDQAVFDDVSRSQMLLKNSDTARQLNPSAVSIDMLGSQAVLAELLGDFQDAVTQDRRIANLPNAYSGSDVSAPIMTSADYAADHDIAASLQWDRGQGSAEHASLTGFAKGVVTYYYPPLPTEARAVALNDWRLVRNDLEDLQHSPLAHVPGIDPLWPVMLSPWLAFADAKLGDFAAAHALIDKTPLDCYLCVRMRGNVAAAERNWTEADRWFARAAKLAPSLPMAYLDWARALAAKGDLNPAIAKLKIANDKGSRFADPLELWGEMLMLQNRSDLALAKFEEASRYAPNWGRLHLKWAEALHYAGKQNEARKQFAIAGALFLTPSERAERVRALHG